MKVIIEKELTDPVVVDGIAQVLGPHYHIFSVDDEGDKTFVKTVDGDIREAAREAERLIDFNTLEVAYKKDPRGFESTTRVPDDFWDRKRVDIWNEVINSRKLDNSDSVEGECCSKHYF